MTGFLGPNGSGKSTTMIRATLAPIPRRPLVLAAKAVTYGLAALAAGQIAAFGSFLTGTALLRAEVPHPALSQNATARKEYGRKPVHPSRREGFRTALG